MAAGPVEILREVTPEIIDDINRLIAQLSPRLSQTTPEMLRRAIDDATVFVTRDAGRIVGAAGLVLAALPTGICGFLENVVVDDACRGQGIGEKLVQATIDHAKTAGATRLDLTTNAGRVAANRLYQRLGFEQRETNVYRFTF